MKPLIGKPCTSHEYEYFKYSKIFTTSDRIIYFLVSALKPEKVTHAACGRAHTLICTGKCFNVGINFMLLTMSFPHLLSCI